MKILYLEDDIALRQTIHEFLEDEGFNVTLAKDGEEALEILYKQNFDLLLLDVQVPKLNGFKLLELLRESNITTPTIFTTSLNSIEDLSTGYEIGADDYIKKPFELKELLLRIKALLKREYHLQNNLIKIDEDIVFDINTHSLNISNQTYTLNPKETQLLKLLYKNKNSCVTFDMIFETVWSFEEENNYESLRTYIKNLRKLLGKERIQNIKKQGYMFV